jgi:hypothetical protein
MLRIGMFLMVMSLAASTLAVEPAFAGQKQQTAAVKMISCAEFCAKYRGNSEMCLKGLPNNPGKSCAGKPGGLNALVPDVPPSSR